MVLSILYFKKYLTFFLKYLVEFAVVAAPDLSVDDAPVVLVIIELQLDADTHVDQAPGHGLH